MHRATSSSRSSLAASLCAAIILGLCACAEIGPRSVSAGRAVYADVINQTEDEQLLNMIVRMRYDETFGMLSVASVTASLRFRAQAGAEVGIGSSDDYEGNLVPFSSGIAYEENPTVTYIPLSGEDFSRRMLSPVTLEEWELLGGYARDKGEVFNLITQRVNQLRNPMTGEEQPSDEFNRFIELYGYLRDVDILQVVDMSTDGITKRYAWRLRRYGEANRELVREFLDLIGVDLEVDGSPLSLPLSVREDSQDSEVVLEARSPLQVIRAFGYGIDIPSEHLEAGIAEPVQLTWSLDHVIRIHSSDTPPDNATVKTLFRDQWFYIDATDTSTKRGFMFLRILVGIRMSHSSDTTQRPMLTLPVN